MRIDIMTLFPDACNAMMSESIIGRARRDGKLTVNFHQIRDYTKNKQKQVDDYPYGGGMGMVMYADALYNCWAAIKEESPNAYTIYMSPQGSVFNQEKAKILSSDYTDLILVCGHYEGIDERFIEECVDEELSIGDFVLTGGEIPAMAVTDAIARMLPGVLSDEECFSEESHYDGLLEYPQYTRPSVWHDREVPEILLSGHHANIKKWRREQSIIRTYKKRPDMLETAPLMPKEKAFVKQLKDADEN